MVAIVIPTLNPTSKVLTLVDDIRQVCENHIIIVNDGSKSECNNIFNQLQSRSNLTVLHHQVNQGKGRALKTAFAYYLENFNGKGIVTADCDGQHTPQDIKKIADKVESTCDTLILGVRDFSGMEIPWKSRFGNTLTRKIISAITGQTLTDTQTGLRGIPTSFMPPLLELTGERFEYETRMLLITQEHNISFEEITIDTIYEDNNSCTNFRPIVDSIKIYVIILQYILSNIVSFIISGIVSTLLDISLFSLLFYVVLPHASGRLILSVAIARCCSLTSNYLINRNFVFKANNTQKDRRHFSFPKYLALALLIMSLSYCFTNIGAKAIKIPIVTIKITVDIILFMVSFYIQKFYIFRTKHS